MNGVASARTFPVPRGKDAPDLGRYDRAGGMQGLEFESAEEEHMVLSAFLEDVEESEKVLRRWRKQLKQELGSS